MKPCDLYPGEEYVWDYTHVPSVENLTKELKIAPRFKFQQYIINHWFVGAHPDTMTMEGFVRVRWENYELLYNITGLPEDWWGWALLKRSHVREE